MKIFFKRIFCLLLVFCAVFGVVMPVAAVETEDNDATALWFEAQPVAKDFETMSFGGVKFSPEAFSYRPGLIDYTRTDPRLQLMGFVEYGYSNFDEAAARYNDYGLYVYIYNPTNAVFSGNELRNCVTLSFGENSTDYHKYPIRLLSTGGDEQGHGLLWLKYKIEISPSELHKLAGDGATRVYNLSELELLLRDTDSNATSYGFGGTYTFTGTMAGYGSESDTLTATALDLLTLELEVHPVFYRRPDAAGASNIGYYDQLNSVYFSIPDEVLEEYGALSGARFEYYKYNSGSIVGFWNYDDYALYKPWEGITINDSFKPAHSLHATQYADGITEWRYNPAWNSPQVLRDHQTVSRLDYVFQYDKGAGAGVIESGIESHYNELWRKYNAGEDQPFFTGEKAEHYVTKELDVTDASDYYLFGTYNGNWFNMIFNRNEAFTFEEFAPIVPVAESDLTDSDLISKLLVDLCYKDELSTACKAADLMGETIHLLRFDASKYFANEVKVEKILNFAAGAVVNEELYFDFDILSLTFVKEGTATVVPTALSPINFVPPLSNLADGSGFNWLVFFIVIALLVVALILLVIFFPIAKLVISGVVFAVSLPFKLIGKIVEAIKERQG